MVAADRTMPMTEHIKADPVGPWRLADYDFELPPEAVADRPAEPRDSARMLYVGRDRWDDGFVRDLPGLLEPGDVIVVNDTRVIPARLAGRRGAAKVEVTLHKRESADTWRAFARPAKKLRVGDRFEIAPDFAAAVAEKGAGGEIVLRFDCAGDELMAALSAHGTTPLPPYIKRPADAQDREDYQTVYAARDGAVAAPTAGLHFTDDLFAALDARGVKRATVTLHVGAGTFLPVKTEDIREHRMHGEWGSVSNATAETINAAHAAGKRIIAVGTTSLRLLESAAAPDGRVGPFSGETGIFIYPGYQFRAVDRLMTNFHLPKSTLFMLVSAFAGLERMKAAYAHAIAAGYRFYSFGDACLLDRIDP